MIPRAMQSNPAATIRTRGNVLTRPSWKNASRGPKTTTRIPMSRIVSPSSCRALRSSITTDSPFRGGRESRGLGVQARNQRIAGVSESPLEWVEVSLHTLGSWERGAARQENLLPAPSSLTRVLTPPPPLPHVGRGGGGGARDRLSAGGRAGDPRAPP